ncbi:hypothetical protein ACQP1O_19745 [Nocardia sp. CA-151230]|uniref:hypothetical protein n=1 Tax=Nocardia sp. CA-151230 TaxID=3239982 RepID=UPI003D8C9582
MPWSSNGVLEQAVIGPHGPSGFTGYTDGAQQVVPESLDEDLLTGFGETGPMNTLA